MEEMFVRDEVRAIICARGGYGSNYLLKALDLKKIRSNPKIFVGYSDLTSLLTYFTDAAGLVTFHGPMVAKDFADPNGIDLDSWGRALDGSSEWPLELDSDVKPLVEGSAEGILYGGCLSILVASLGTPYEIQTAGTILFIEDIAAKPYQIDRMLMQLKLAGKLTEVRGIVFGEMVDCTQNKDQSYTFAGCNPARGWRPGCTRGFRFTFRARFSRQHHTAFRGACGFEGFSECGTS